MEAGFDAALEAARARAGEGVDADVEFEFLAGESGVEACGGDLGGEVGAEFGGGAGEGLGGEFADLVGDVVADAAEFVAEAAAHGAADRAAEGGQAEVGPAEFVHRAVAVGDLDGAGESVYAALFQCLEGRPLQRRAGRGLGDAARDHPGDQLFHRDAHCDLRGDAGRYTGGGADAGPGGGDGGGDLDGGHDHRADDHELGVLDVVGAVFEDLGLFLAPFADGGEGGLVAGQQFVAVGGDRVVGLALRERGQGGGQRGGGGVVDGVEGFGGGGPGVGEPAHGGFVTVGPISRAQNVFRDPLQ
ncbi:hypothetical protein [Nocardia sp. AG03]|uniref:hypothetical protein n=1 Tax=Nocardia sp. AG03 TaxID=3025312 RepID=UPI00241896AE|nr:hypothetical protein [Nocardia sp. AG03]